MRKRSTENLINISRVNYFRQWLHQRLMKIIFVSNLSCFFKINWFHANFWAHGWLNLNTNDQYYVYDGHIRVKIFAAFQYFLIKNHLSSRVSLYLDVQNIAHWGFNPNEMTNILRINYFTKVYILDWKINVINSLSFRVLVEKL